MDYDPGLWTATRDPADFDEDSIGLLAVPAPSLDELSAQLRTYYGFLAEPDDTERRIIAGGAGSRRLVLRSLAELPGCRLADRAIY